MWMTVAYVFDALYYSLIDFGDLQIGIWPWVSLYQKRLRPFSFRKKNPIEIISESESVRCSVMSSSLRPMDCSLPGFSVHGILQARLLEWLAIPFSRGSSQPWDWTQTSCTEGSFYTIWTTREAQRLIRVNVYWAFPVRQRISCESLWWMPYVEITWPCFSMRHLLLSSANTGGEAGAHPSCSRAHSWSRCWDWAECRLWGRNVAWRRHSVNVNANACTHTHTELGMGKALSKCECRCKCAHTHTPLNEYFPETQELLDCKN